mgnify:CR=1 FL=1
MSKNGKGIFQMERDHSSNCEHEYEVQEQLELPIYKTPLHVIDAFLSERLGTFQDNLHAPIHSWFKYPAGFSYKLVEALIEDHNLNADSWVLDPFVGCGTTSVVAKQRSINSVGIEAHLFVYWVAKVKCFWEYDMEKLYQSIQKLFTYLYRIPSFPGAESLSDFPELVRKCYSDSNLWVLKFIRDHLDDCSYGDEEADFFRLALTNTLREASKAGTGWPYIAPSKYHEKSEQPALEVFHKTVKGMYRDLLDILTNHSRAFIETRLLLMDARARYPMEGETIDLAVTSPPYLNNYDYADRTRLEMYFFGWAKSWREITNKVRDKLITAATTQVVRNRFLPNPLCPDIHDLDPKLYKELSNKIHQIEEIRPQKGGKKSYDLMVAGYFNDMLTVIKQVYRVLKPSAHFVLVLGDSAPYGIHIPTEEYLGRLSVAVGFRNYSIHNLRERGRKWKHNPQRHKVMLKEGILILEK